METPPDIAPHLVRASKRLAQRALTVCENRLQLLMVEVQGERERILLAIWLALGAAAFGLLAGIALTFLAVVALWEHSPIITLAVLTLFYATVGALFYRKLSRLQREWQTLPATLDQLRKDCACLEKTPD